MVKDFRQPVRLRAGKTPGSTSRPVPPAAQQRAAVVVGIYLSAFVMVLMGVGLLTLRQTFIPAGDARLAALICLSAAAADVMLVQYLKRIWRKRDGR